MFSFNEICLILLASGANRGPTWEIFTEDLVAWLARVEPGRA